MRLVIYSEPLNRLLTDFEYKDGKTIANYIKESLKDDANRWLDYGVIEWIRDEEGMYAGQRHTSSTDPEFLFRLKDYLQKQFSSFTYILGERFMIELTQKFKDRDWFHSVGTDQYGRIVVYVNYMCHDTLHDIPDHVDGKQVLVHFAGYLLAKREQFTDSGIPRQEVSELNKSINSLVADLGKQKVSDIFYEIHDGPNALTQLSDKHPFARECLDKLYEEYGFDVLFDLLENE